MDLGRNLRPSLSWLVLCFALFMPALLTAQEEATPDEIVLNDGSRLLGRISSMGDGVLKVDTPYAGTLSVKFENIRTIVSGGTHTFQLSDGSRHVGRPRLTEDGRIQLDTELSGTIPVRLGDVTAINPPPPVGVTHKGNITIGGRITDGNTRTKSASAQANYEARGDRHRLTIRGDWNYEENRGDITARNASGAIKYDFFATERLFAYVNATFQGDDLADLNLRSTLGAGVGYQFVDNDRVQYYEEAGISFFDEDFDLGSDDRYTAVRVAGKFDWIAVPDRMTVFHIHEILPGLEDQDDVFVDTQTGTRLNLIDNFYASFQVNWTWDNTPAAGARRSDTEYIWGLGYSFSL